MEISFHSHLDFNTVIATKFCTWHDSCAVVTYAKICCDLMASNGITAKRNFHRIWIAGKNWLVKRAPVQVWSGHQIPLTSLENLHYNDIIMSTMMSQITSLTIVYSTVYSDADQRKHQSSVSLAFVRGIHRGLVNSLHKRPVTWKMFPFSWCHHEIKHFFINAFFH